MEKRRVCKDCEPGSKRPAPHPGPRCTTHHRAVRTARKRTTHGKYVQATYGITEEQYWAIHALQGGRCYICQRASGRTRRLAVDHDHACCAELPACGQCVRGLLCKPCNRDVLGHLRDSTDALTRAVDYLTDPPAKRVLSPTGGT